VEDRFALFLLAVFFVPAFLLDEADFLVLAFVELAFLVPVFLVADFLVPALPALFRVAITRSSLDLRST